MDRVSSCCAYVVCAGHLGVRAVKTVLVVGNVVLRALCVPRQDIVEVGNGLTGRVTRGSSGSEAEVDPQGGIPLKTD